MDVLTSGSSFIEGSDETDNPPAGDEDCRGSRAEEHRVGERVSRGKARQVGAEGS